MKLTGPYSPKKVIQIPLEIYLKKLTEKQGFLLQTGWLFDPAAYLPIKS